MGTGYKKIKLYYYNYYKSFKDKGTYNLNPIVRNKL